MEMIKGIPEKEYRKNWWKEYYSKNKEKVDKCQKEYRQKNKEKIKKWNEKYKAQYYVEHYKEKRILRVRKYRAQWLEIIKQKGMDRCSKCGYDKCFQALDFHHVNPVEKEWNIGRLLVLIPTDMRIKELDKCICLCSNCHRELHAEK